MDTETIRNYALELINVEECLPFGPETLVFKTGGKIFLLLSLDEMPPHINVKCDPEMALEFRAQYASVIPGYHMNKKHWNTVICDGTIAARVIKDFIRQSYELVSRNRRK